MSEKLEQFRIYREKMNEKILAEKNQQINRFFALDTRSYEDGALDVRTKEMLGLVSSMVLRCDDCISYHLIRCKESGINRAELFEIFNIALLVGGSIIIPHLRRAVDLLEDLEREGE